VWGRCGSTLGRLVDVLMPLQQLPTHGQFHNIKEVKIIRGQKNMSVMRQNFFSFSFRSKKVPYDELQPL